MYNQTYEIHLRRGKIIRWNETIRQFYSFYSCCSISLFFFFSL